MWKDTTSYSQEDKERKQRTFTAQSGRLRITVTCGHIDYRPEWVFHCYTINMDTQILPHGISEEQAKETAIKRVRARLEEMAVDLSIIENEG